MTRVETFLVGISLVPGSLPNSVNDVSLRAFGPSLISDWFDPAVASAALAEALSASLVTLSCGLVVITAEGSAVRERALRDAA